jgi:catechol 2,3-dioxygenase
MYQIRPAIRPLRARLHEIALCSPAPKKLCDFYNRGLGFQFQEGEQGFIGTASGRRLRIIVGEAKALGYAAFVVENLDALANLNERLERAKVPVVTSEAAGLRPGALRFADPDGNAFVFGLGDESVSSSSDIDPLPARLQHIVFASRDLQRMLQFFVEVVGFQLTDRVLDESGGVRTAFVRCSEEHHSLAVFAANESRLDHHCYETGNWNFIRDWADHFAKIRIPLKWGPGRHGPGDNLFIFVHDPDGNWVEISAELEQVRPDRTVGEWPHEEHTLNSWGMAPLRS